jgi:hypothetical protein
VKTAMGRMGMVTAIWVTVVALIIEMKMIKLSASLKREKNIIDFAA